MLSCADYNLMDGTAPAPVDLSISGVTDSTVALRWTMSDDEAFYYYMVLYGAEDSTGDIIDLRDKVADTLYFRQDTIKTVSSLAAGTRYGFRVLVTTEQGATTPSNIVDTTTLSDTIVDSTTTPVLDTTDLPQGGV